MTRPVIAVSLPPAEQGQVVAELRQADFDAVPILDPGGLDALLAERPDVGGVILDGDADLDLFLDLYGRLREGSRVVPVLVIQSRASLGQVAGLTSADVRDEFLARPCSAESIRWRVEAMCIRFGANNREGPDPIQPTTTAGYEPTPATASTRPPRVIAVYGVKRHVGKVFQASGLG